MDCFLDISAFRAPLTAHRRTTLGQNLQVRRVRMNSHHPPSFMLGPINGQTQRKLEAILESKLAVIPEFISSCCFTYTFRMAG